MFALLDIPITPSAKALNSSLGVTLASLSFLDKDKCKYDDPFVWKATLK